MWCWLIRLFRFQVYISTINELHTALCAHRPKSNLLPSPCIGPPYPLLPSHPHFSGNHYTIVCVIYLNLAHNLLCVCNGNKILKFVSVFYLFLKKSWSKKKMISIICTWNMCLEENLFITDVLYKEYQDALKSFISFLLSYNCSVDDKHLKHVKKREQMVKA